MSASGVFLLPRKICCNSWKRNCRKPATAPRKCATGWSRTAPPAGAASSWSTTCRCPRSSWAAASPPGLFRLDPRQPDLLFVSLQLARHELLELCGRVGHRLDADRDQPLAYLRDLHRAAHLAPELVNDIGRCVGRREHREPAAVVLVLRQPGLRGGRHFGGGRMALVAGVREHLGAAALVVRQDRRRRGEHGLHFAGGERGGRRPAALVRDVGHHDSRYLVEYL